jgi:hypothetical protein
MKPLHASVTKISRCPCCQSKYSRNSSAKKNNTGKTAARMKAKQAVRRELNS